MNREIQIYIKTSSDATDNNYSKVDLFKDEFINISSSIQNVQDLSKVYTDFSQSFTVPSTQNNNSIFEYFYENDLDNTIDHNLRRYAYIEIGHTPFRSGKIQLEGSSIRDGKAEHYTITFYGDLVSLKDTFGNKKLSDLDYSAISNPYTGTGVKARLTDTTTDYDVRYPMITSKNLWTYADATSTDLSTSTGRVSWNELFPAIKVSKIFEAIQTDFGLTFNSTFLQTDLFKKLFLWGKNTDNLDNKLNGASLPITSYNNYPSYAGFTTNIYNNDNNTYNITGGVWRKCENVVTFIIDNPPIITDPQWVFYINIYVNDIFNSTVKIDTTLDNRLEIYRTIGIDYSQKLTIKIVSEQNINIKYTVNVERFYDNDKKNGGFLIAQNTTGVNLSNLTNSISANVPDITISDFFSGILKQFNLTCYATAVNSFQIEPLDDWYSKGAVKDITRYIDVESITVDRVPLYKNIAFNYEKSESFINRKFGDSYGREWGDTSMNYPYDGGDYKVQLPFENLQFQKFSTTPMQVGYSLTKEPDYKSYIPKPVLLYYNGAMTTAIRFYNGTTETTETNIALFGNDLSYNNQIYSLNFAPETSTWYNTPIQNSLFANYYFGYLSNLFNTKNRLTKLSAYFPISLITSLKLNDRLVIKDKRYLINSINSELTSGKVELELINDFRPVVNEINSGNFGSAIGAAGGTFAIGVQVANDVNSIDISTTTSGATLSHSTITADTLLTVTKTANSTPIEILSTEDNYSLITEDNFELIGEQGADILIDIVKDINYQNGTTETQTIYISQQ